MKSSGIKAEIIGRLITNWKKLCHVQTEYANDEQQSATSSNDLQGTLKSPQTKSRNLPNFETIHQWTKDISPIRGNWFMKLYQYLITSRGLFQDHPKCVILHAFQVVPDH